MTRATNRRRRDQQAEKRHATRKVETQAPSPRGRQAHAALKLTTDGRMPGAVSMEARCESCDEPFNPSGGRESEGGDYIGRTFVDTPMYRHFVRQDGEECGGAGALMGGWR